MPTSPAATTVTTQKRDPFIDFIRAGSLVVVVVWHWAFTIFRFRDDGPHVTSPLGFTSGLWLLTWAFQVMPLFFFVGGFAHMKSWEVAQSRGVSLSRFVAKRVRSLVVPALVLLALWGTIGFLLSQKYDDQYVWRSVKLVVSPLWFLMTYLLLVLLLPAALRLHRRFDVLVPVVLGGLAMAVDVLRFNYGYSSIGWLNMVFVWGLAHQLGFFYPRLAALDQRSALAIALLGLFGLLGLVGSGLYPGSMVGVPGDKFSNMAPPTFVIVALLCLQVGVLLLMRDRVTRIIAEPKWAKRVVRLNAIAMPLFLFHSTGMAIARWLLYTLQPDRVNEEVRPDLDWWLSRPIAVVSSLLFTMPVIWLFGRVGPGSGSGKSAARADG
jgi:peptidoglycan/LPS O-acetylase OafA/YrhL